MKPRATRIEQLASNILRQLEVKGDVLFDFGGGTRTAQRPKGIQDRPEVSNKYGSFSLFPRGFH